MDPQNHAVVLRFTAPDSGYFRVDGFFKLIDTTTHPHFLQIRQNGNRVIFHRDTAGGTFGTRYGFIEFPWLQAGETLDFIVSAKNNDWVALSTGLTARVERIAGAKFYSAVWDFGRSKNPTSPWSYMESKTFQDPPALLPNIAPVPDTPVLLWGNGQAMPEWSGVGANTGDGTVSHYTMRIDPDMLWMDPQSRVVMVRFTAPESARYQVEGMFRMIDTTSHGHYVGIQHNRTNILFTQDTSGQGYGAEFPFSLRPSLNAGETLDFSTTMRNSDWVALATGLKATVFSSRWLAITQVAFVPPAQLVLAWETGEPSQGYTVETSTSLTNPSWTPVEPAAQWPVTHSTWT
ncbi:hypothetical protein EG834_12015, partial [bacterium]|nr:hypothetical protein [bacterium]